MAAHMVPQLVVVMEALAVAVMVVVLIVSLVLEP